MFTHKLWLPILFAGSTLLSACGDSGTSSAPNGITLDMQIPDSMTGGSSSITSSKTMSMAKVANAPLAATTTGTGQPCSYIGVADDDIFRNGYQTTRFMVSALATWTCIADLLIDVSDLVPHNGQIVETENDLNADNYDADEPTHYSVSDNSETQTTINLYYGYSRSNPPVVGETPQFFISWNEETNGDIDGRIVIDGTGVNWEDHQADDPVMMRMDFNYTDTQQVADMFLQFDAGNHWAEGFRIKLTKDLTANALDKVFEAQGMIEMKAQFLPLSGITEVPDVQLYSVADGFGNGAAIAELQNISLPLPVNIFTGNTLGHYLLTKRDVYYFEYDMDWDYINKTVTASEYRGGRTTPATGGTWLFPFNPSLDLIVTELALDPAYFTGTQCANIGDDCNDLLNRVYDFINTFPGLEANQGTEPTDWRGTSINSAQYLTTVYPNGVDWTDAFDFSFTPGL
ncbi:MAG TPA: hypothetical protein VIQ03_03775 [Gammaproteobacteria bacterium]